MQNRIAVLDLGTNTFHLQIAEINGRSHKNLYKEKLPVMLGKGGISNGVITEAAQKRAMDALGYFKHQANVFKCDKIRAIATSAFRNAKNGQEFANQVHEQLGITIQIIDGNEEAALIYDGVSLCVGDVEPTHLVVDIGGGSVEFIIGQNGKPKWQLSLEIGGQRLMDKFHIIDPIPNDALEALYYYLDQQLSPVYKAINELKPTVLIGSSGSFDTLDEIYRKKTNLDFDIENILSDHLPIFEYKEIFNELVSKTKAERLQIPGMIPLRADMIVVASCLINKLVDNMPLQEIMVSTCSLKEGVIKRFINSFDYLQVG
jgi:exopolyphosphatase / guanosine-5'-triphosphate,3'-diphosphate pyrophosphatase